jgi:hypothetical protein
MEKKLIGIKFDASEMVKEFRRETELIPVQTFQPYRVFPQSRPSLLKRFFYRINWNIAFEWTLWTFVIAVWVTLAILIYIPFLRNHILK